MPKVAVSSAPAAFLILAAAAGAALEIDLGCEASREAMTKQLGPSSDRQGSYWFSINATHYKADFIELTLHGSRNTGFIAAMIYVVDTMDRRVGAFIPNAGFRTTACEFQGSKGTIATADTELKPLPTKIVWKPPGRDVGPVAIVGVVVDIVGMVGGHKSFGWNIVGKVDVPSISTTQAPLSTPAPTFFDPVLIAAPLTPSPKEEEGSSVGLIVGIAAGVMLGLAVGTGIALFKYRHLCDSASSASAAMDVPVTAEPPPMRPAPRQPTPMISTEKHRMTPRIGELAMPVYIGTQKSEVVKDSEVTEV